MSHCSICVSQSFWWYAVYEVSNGLRENKNSDPLARIGVGLSPRACVSR